eukprot:TRINITY_DN11926_c0_g1_i3.p3 TRINITY_DN11926_c0_g1~~TRINITY_DN11926_c0_g1_i3.p3  ORF type:complete len:289 (+),score=53.02 TRINITY_DN11926_c0_g1_i3:88-954(+)
MPGKKGRNQPSGAGSTAALRQPRTRRNLAVPPRGSSRALPSPPRPLPPAAGSRRRYALERRPPSAAAGRRQVRHAGVRYSLEGVSGGQELSMWPGGVARPCAPASAAQRQGAPAEQRPEQGAAAQHCEKLLNMMRFVREANSGELKVLGCKRHQLLAQLKQRGYTGFPTALSAESAEAGGAESAGAGGAESAEAGGAESAGAGGAEYLAASSEEEQDVAGAYNYLLGIPIGEFCEEKAAELEQQLLRAEAQRAPIEAAAAAASAPGGTGLEQLGGAFCHTSDELSRDD